MAKRTPKPKPDVVVTSVTRCQKCGSTDREPYAGTVTRPIAGLDAGGKPFTHVIWRRTRCTACGQARIDRHHENRSARSSDREQTS